MPAAARCSSAKKAHTPYAMTRWSASPGPKPKYGRRNARNWTIRAGQPSLTSQLSVVHIRRRGGRPGIELRSVIRTGRHSVASNRLVTNPSSLRIVLTAPISHPERRAAVVAAAAQAADPGAPAAMPSLARVSSANRPAPWSPAFIAFTAAGPGPRGKDAGSRCCPAEVACGVWLASSVWRHAGHVRSCWYVALRCAGSIAAAKPGPASVGQTQRSVSIGAGAARRIG